MLASASIKCFIPGRLPSLRIRRIGFSRLSRTSAAVAGGCPASTSAEGRVDSDETRNGGTTRQNHRHGRERDGTKRKVNAVHTF